MPQYEYRCPRCGAVSTEYRPINGRNRPALCQQCWRPNDPAPMERVRSTPAIVIR